MYRYSLFYPPPARSAFASASVDLSASADTDDIASPLLDDEWSDRDEEEDSSDDVEDDDEEEAMMRRQQRQRQKAAAARRERCPPVPQQPLDPVS
jgi:hypothetical protein